MARLITGMAAILALAAAGCGSGSDESTEPLQNGVYEWELTKEYLLENGISERQATNESGHQEVTLDDGDFVARWKTAENRTGSCRGTYEADGNRVTFKWVSGCFGDWAMSYSVDGDTVTWSDQEALPPHDSDEDQNVNEVFNSVPWTRVGDAPAS